MALTKVVTDIIGSDTLSGISGSFRGELSSSVYLRQVSSTISGSLGTNASVIRTLDRTTLSGSLGANAAVIRTLDRTTLSCLLYTSDAADDS